MRPVRLGRAHRDVEHLRDLLVRVAEREQPQHLPLAVRERILLGAAALLGLGRDEPRTQRRMDVAAAAGDLPDRGDELGVGRLLQHVAARAGRERLADVARIVLHREHQHLRPRARLQQRRASPRCPLPPGMTTSISTTSGFARARLEDRVARRSPPRRRLDVLLGVEQEPQPRADDGMVVDDQDADRSRSGTSATIVVPAPRRDSIRQPAAEQRDPLAHPDQAERPRRVAPGRSRVRRPRSPPPPPRPCARATMLTRVASGMLDDVRQRLLHDPVERRLDLARQPLVAEPRLELDARARSARRTSSTSRSSAGTSPKSSSAFGRSSTASRRTSWSVATTSSRSERDRRRGSSSLDRLLERPSGRAGST